MVTVEEILREERMAIPIMLSQEPHRRRCPLAQSALTKNLSSLKMSKNKITLQLKLKIKKKGNRLKRCQLRAHTSLNNSTD